MKTITNYINEAIFGGVIKQAVKFKLYKSDEYKETVAYILLTEENYDVFKDFINKNNIKVSDIKNIDIAIKAGYVLVRPILNKNELSISWNGIPESDLNTTYPEIGKISLSDFTIEYWKDHDWSIKPLLQLL